MLEDLRYRLRSLLQSKGEEEQLDVELRFHFDQEVEKHLKSGVSRTEALRRARGNFGGVEQVKEECRDARGVRLVENLRQDFLYGLRLLRKSPRFTCLAVLTLTLGIGANTAIFSMVNALLLHPYDFRDLDQLVRVWEYRGVDEDIDSRRLAAADAEQFGELQQIFSSIATYRCRDFSLTKGGTAEPVRGCGVSAHYFDVLGVGPSAGRGFSAEDDQPGAEKVAIVSHGFWQRRLGGGSSVLGSDIQINGQPYTVIGIMPLGFDYPVPMEIWTPLALTPAEKADRTGLSLEALGRLRPGVRVAQAKAALESVALRLKQEFPITNGDRQVSVLLLRKELYSFSLPIFLLLQGAALFVLLLAIANLVNVYFARMVGRQKELALRLALGGSRGRLAQLLICESLVLSGIAAIMTVATSFWSVRVLRNSISPDWTMWVPGWNAIHVDTTVLAFTVFTAVAAGVVFGLASVVHAGKMKLNQALKEGGPGNMTRATNRLRSALVVAQVMFALTLLVCAGLMIEGFTHLADVYQGFEPSRVLRAEINLPENKYSGDAQIVNFYQDLLPKVAALPGAAGVALNTNNPASNVDNSTTLFTVEGSVAPKASDTPSADVETASAGYFQVLHIPVRSGRGFTDADAGGAPLVVVVSESMAKRFWPGGNALGRRIKLGTFESDRPWFTVVGVAGDVRQNWWNPPGRAVIYQSFLQFPDRGMKVLLRCSSSPENYGKALREIARGLDAEVVVTELGTLEKEVQDSIAIVRVMGMLMGIFGGVALVLSAVGVYGVLAESVEQRRREFGIRLALGARTADILKQVVLHSLQLTGIGLVIALPLSLLISRGVSHYVFGLVAISFGVPLFFSAVLMAVGVVAAFVPAGRAMSVDPMVTLRHE
jgi:putative ABC transport system permease protein